MMRAGMCLESEPDSTKSGERIIGADKKTMFCVCVLKIFVTLQPNLQGHGIVSLYHKRVVTNLEHYGRLSGE